MDLFVVGSLATPEFRLPREWLAERGHVCFFDSIHDILAATDNFQPTGLQTSVRSPALIVIAQSYRGQFSDQAIERIRQVFPLAQLLTLIGSWGEGEARSGTPLPGIERVYAAEFVTRMSRLNSSFSLARSLQPTLSDDERLLARASGETAQVDALVVSHDLSFAESIADMLVVAGGSAVAARIDSAVRVPRLSVVAYDAHPHQELRTVDVARLQKLGLPIVCLVDFPRGYEIDQLLEMGVESILPKPFAMDDLIFELNEAAIAQAARQNGLPKSESAA